MTLMLVNHGGKCCGIKTIYGFGYGSSSYPGTEYPLEKKKQDNRDQYGSDVSSDTPFFTDEAPQETTLERLKRYIDFIKRRRPQNIVEIALCESSWAHADQYRYWHQPLLDLGFKESVSGVNSNSENTVHVYHLVIDEGPACDDNDDDENDVPW